MLVAGIFGTEGRLEGLDARWKRYLDAPLCGRKEPLSRFHAYDCDNNTGEFFALDADRNGLLPPATAGDHYRIRRAAYGMACSRKDWDAIILGEMRSVLGDSERFCINQCYVKSIAWVQANTFDPDVKFVFDNRPNGVQRYAGTIHDAFARWIQPSPTLTGYEFLSSTQIRPLQAADLIAWELYRYAKKMLKSGIGTPAQSEILHLKANMDFQAQIALRGRIIQVRDYWLDYFKKTPDHLRQMANHFDSFDPKNPDYSKLYE